MDYQLCWKEWVCNMTDLNLDIIVDGKTLNEIISFTESYTDAVQREYNIHKEESELLYMESKIDTDSYFYMLEECEAVFCEKVQKTVDTLADKLTRSIEMFNKKLRELFHKEEPLTKIQKMKQVLKLHPEIANSKVRIKDRRADMKKVDECKDGLLKTFLSQKSTKKYDKKPLLAFGKKYKEWEHQQKKQQLKKDVTMMVALAVIEEALRHANLWLERDRRISELKLDQIQNPKEEMSEPFMRMYCESANVFMKWYSKFTAREQELNKEAYEQYQSTMGVLEEKLKEIEKSRASSNENIVHV